MGGLAADQGLPIIGALFPLETPWLFNLSALLTSNALLLIAVGAVLFRRLPTEHVLAPAWMYLVTALLFWSLVTAVVHLSYMPLVLLVPVDALVLHHLITTTRTNARPEEPTRSS